MKMHFISRTIGGCLAALWLVAGAQAAPKVGVAAAVKNNVQRVTGSGAQQLNVGADLYTSERIRTGEDSIAQILLLDKTTLTVGPRAEMTLDNFVYNPSQGGAGRVVLNAVQGTFRFISGSQKPSSYTIKTPVGNLGVRGTIVDLIVQNGQVTVILVEGALTMTVNGRTYTLSKPGTAYTFTAGGGVQGPFAWDGTILNTSAQVSFPLYGWHFQGEPLNNGLPNVNMGNIDQLNGIIQRGLTPPPVTPPPSSGCGYCN
ncbi:MAG: FecR domain-containing protein [Xanthobacteraceae bacterium]|nr:FecR domain-containing protein [Xanthobacteraceae bacterium]